MLRLETVFGAGPAVTPDFAALLANRASKFSARVYLERGTTQLSVESLIGILAMDLRKGMELIVAADGEDEAEAAQQICALLRDGK